MKNNIEVNVGMITRHGYGQIQRVIQQDAIKLTFQDNNNEGARESIQH